CLPASGFDEPQFLVEDVKHASEFVAALQDKPGCGNNGIGALLARVPGGLDDLEKRRLAGAAEHREHGPVGEPVDGIVAPFIGGDHAAVEPQDLVELFALEADRYVHSLAPRFIERHQY